MADFFRIFCRTRCAASLLMSLDGECECAVFGGGGGVLDDVKFFVAEVHEAVVVHVLGAVGGEEVVEVGEEVFGTDVDFDFVAHVVFFVEFEGAAIVGGVDDHHAVHAVACGHVCDVELLTFGAFVADEGSEGLDDMVRVAS